MGKNADNADAPFGRSNASLSPGGELLPQPRLSVAFFSLLYLILATTKRLRQQFVSVSERKRLVAAAEGCVCGVCVFYHMRPEVIRKHLNYSTKK